MHAYEQLLARIRRLPIPLENFGFGEVLKLLQDGVVYDSELDRELFGIVDERVAHIEGQLMTSAFLDPDEAAGLGDGDVNFLETASGQAIRTSVLSNRPNAQVHYLFGGKPHAGKSCGMAYFASQLADAGHPTLVFDPNGFFRHLRCMQNHDFVMFDHLRINPFDEYEGVLSGLTFEYMTRLLAECYPLIYAEYELIRCLLELIEQQKANVPALIKLLQSRQDQFRRGSRRPNYAESGEMVLQNLVNATRGVFECSKGMNLEAMLAQNNIVLEILSTPKHQSYFCRLIFQVITLLASAGRKPQQGLTVFLDEGQTMAAASGEEFVSVMTTIRHSGINCVVNYQNLSKAPAPLLGCVDVLVCFRCTDRFDVDRFARSANLTADQAQRIPLLNEGECICSMPRSNWKAAFLAKVPCLEFEHRSDAEIVEKSKAFAKRFPWKACDPSADLPAIQSMLPDDAGRLMANVLDQRNEFCPVTHRYEQARLRSTEVRRRARELLEREGLIAVDSLAVNAEGRPWTLIEPTAKAFELYRVQWKKTRGSLPTRCGHQLLFQKLKKLKGRKAKREGVLGEKEDAKQVDLLLFDPLVTIEIAGSPDHECHNALHCLAHGTTKHYVVCTTRDVECEVKKKFAAHDALKRNEKVCVTVLTRVMKEEWTP